MLETNDKTLDQIDKKRARRDRKDRKASGIKNFKCDHDEYIEQMKTEYRFAKWWHDVIAKAEKLNAEIGVCDFCGTANCSDVKGGEFFQDIGNLADIAKECDDAIKRDDVYRMIHRLKLEWFINFLDTHGVYDDLWRSVKFL